MVPHSSSCFASTEKLSTTAPLPFSCSAFETSTTMIERTRWKINRPVPWRTLDDEEEASKFIKNPPQRDKRKNLGKNRFRLLLVQYTNGRSQLYKQTSLISTSVEYGWIGERFKFFIKNNTGGSAVLESSESIGFIAQAPVDDDYPFFSFSLTDQYLEGHRRDADWVCLFFASPELSLQEIEDILCRDLFPHDYVAPISPDFMFLPVAMLRWQVQQISDELTKIKEEIIKQDEDLVTKDMRDFKNIRTNLFQMRKRHLMLNRRWLFAKELAQNLANCFDMIERRNSIEEPVAYSTVLRNNVLSHEAFLGNLLHDLDTTPLRMEAQQTMIDNQTSMMIAKNSEIAAEEARRDSSSMKTIAVVTLVFLPGTFVAAIFSMSLFNWQADKESGERLASSYTWLYFAIALPLTLIVMLVWILWSRWTDKQYRRKWADIKSV